MPFFGIDYIDLDPLRSENGPFSKIDRDLACLKLTYYSFKIFPQF